MSISTKMLSLDYLQPNQKPINHKLTFMVPHTITFEFVYFAHRSKSHKSW